jgi:hypothetical protein
VILMVLQSAQAQECKRELMRRTQEPVTACPTVRDAVHALRQDGYSAVVVDQNLLELNSPLADSLLRYSGTATIVFVSSGIWGVDRVSKEVELALERAKRERHNAQETARRELKEQLSGAVAGILLSSELALKANSVPLQIEEKLRSIRELALQMTHSLR